MAGEYPEDFDDFTLSVEWRADADHSDSQESLSVRAITREGDVLTAQSVLQRNQADTYARRLMAGHPNAPSDRSALGLAAALLPEGIIREAFKEALRSVGTTNFGLRLILEFKDARLAAVPWELAGLETDPATGPEFLVRHPDLSVCRRATSAVPATEPPAASGPVVIGTALTVHGHWTDRSGAHWLDESDSEAIAGDTSVLAEVLDNPSSELVAIPEPLTRMALAESLSEPSWGFYFGGHGLRDGIVLASAEGPGRPETLHADDLAVLLRQAQVAVVVLASCDGASPDLDVTADGENWYNLAETLVRSGVPAVVGMRGPVTNREALDLTKELFNGLAGYRNIDKALADARRKLTGGWWRPVLHTSSTPVPRVSRPPALRRAALQAWHLPPDWCPDDPRQAPSDAHPARLDVLWGLDRRPIRSVLADEPGTDLVSALEAVEADVLKARTGRPGSTTSTIPRRRWFGLPDSGTERPLSTLGSLYRAVGQPAGLQLHLREHPQGASIGLVLSYREQPAGDIGRLLLEAGQIVNTWPQAGLVIHVTAEQVTDALRLAAKIGDQLTKRHIAWPEVGLTVLTRVLPSAGPLVAHSVRRPTAVQRIMEPAAGESAGTAAHRELAESVDLAFDHLTFTELVSRLRTIRDEPDGPDAYQGFLAYHARYGIHRAISLLAAASRDGDLDSWLAACPAECLVGSSEVPNDYQSDAVDAIVLGLLRRTADDPSQVRSIVAPWRLRIGKGVLELADYLGSAEREQLTQPERGLRDLDLLLGCTRISAAETALRAGIGSRASVRDLAPGGHLGAAAWALLPRRQLDESTASLVAELTLPERRVIGFLAPGQDSSEPDAETSERLAPVRQLLRPAFPALSTLTSGIVAAIPSQLRSATERDDDAC